MLICGEINVFLHKYQSKFKQLNTIYKILSTFISLKKIMLFNNSCQDRFILFEPSFYSFIKYLRIVSILSLAYYKLFIISRLNFSKKSVQFKLDGNTLYLFNRLTALLFFLHKACCKIYCFYGSIDRTQ